MCETFLFYHLCGHVYSKKLWKCSKEIVRQLDLAYSDEGRHNYPAQPCFTELGSCLDCRDTERLLKPILCEKCEQAGIVSDWLKSDPAMRFEIVKGWLHSKRAENAVRMLVNADIETVEPADRRDGAEKSTSAKDSQGAQTLPMKGTLFRIKISDSEDTDVASLEQWSPLSLEPPVNYKPQPTGIGKDSEAQLDALEVLTPILADYITGAEAVEDEIEAVEQKMEQRAQDVREDTQSVGYLKTRVAAARKKLEGLIAESTQRSLDRLNAQTKVSLTEDDGVGL